MTACSVGFALALSAALLAAAESPVFRGDVTLVKVEAQVYDRSTRALIRNLQAADFQISDGGQPREIAYFAHDTGPLDLLLLLDVSGTMQEVLPNLAAQAREALGHLGTKDRVAIMAFGKYHTLTQPFTGDFDAAAQGLRHIFDVQVGLDTDINQAVWGAADYLRRSGGTARRAVLVLTDNIQESRVPDSLVDEQLFAADAVLDGLLVRGHFPVPHLVHSGVLRFALKTGGEVIEGPQPGARLGEMVERIKARYSIYFRPAEAASGQERKIQVTLTPEARKRYPHAVVRARKSYFPKPDSRTQPEVGKGQRVS
ncbi:MAG TPA: VWA domain-containing protein [Bryobacteraceae bacterium]|nr:VWA domain-containing protein [Bryobacteraceae bacterium]